MAAATCGGDDEAPTLPSVVEDESRSTSTTPTSVVRPRGGRARVVVQAEPDPSAPTLTGAAVRSLVLPQLFVAEPDGSWSPSLVEPGSDRLAADGRLATFRLRGGAVWSDGSPITVADLQRSVDARFVSSVGGGGAGGSPSEVRLTFTQPFPGWRRLWSGVDSVPAPAPGVWGGPFVVAGRTPGLETVLARNDRWWGAPAPWLDEVRLVVVPDPTTGRQLLVRGDVDVVAPLAGTNRTPQFRTLPGVSVADAPVASSGGWWFGLVVNPSKVDGDERAGLLSTVDRARFVSVLLRDEALEPSTPVGGDAVRSLRGDTLTLSAAVEDPMTPLLERAMQKRARSAGGRIELRNAETDLVESWLASGEYQAALAWHYDGPSVCHRCRWGDVDDGLAAAADAGDEGAASTLVAKAVGEGVVLPLWRPRPVVAWRGPFGGLRANPYGLFAAWNAWEWWVDPGS